MNMSFTRIARIETCRTSLIQSPQRGRHVYRNIEYQQPQAPEGRHVTTTLYKIRDNKITPVTCQYEA